jgi:hypothetical protein
MYENLYAWLQLHGMEFITMGGSIHPYVGAAVGLIVTIGLIYLGIMAAKERWQKQKKEAGDAVKDVGKDQNASDNTQDKADDFFGDKKK